QNAPAPIHAPAPNLATAQRGLDVRKNPPLSKEEKCFLLTSPFLHKSALRSAKISPIKNAATSGRAHFSETIPLCHANVTRKRVRKGKIGADSHFGKSAKSVGYGSPFARFKLDGC
ncbi:MAG: hypothetical protein WB562_10510, partial [Candidatus Sulfotelmatobacter sp.]